MHWKYGDLFLDEPVHSCYCAKMVQNCHARKHYFSDLTRTMRRWYFGWTYDQTMTVLMSFACRVLLDCNHGGNSVNCVVFYDELRLFFCIVHQSARFSLSESASVFCVNEGCTVRASLLEGIEGTDSHLSARVVIFRPLSEHIKARNTY